MLLSRRIKYVAFWATPYWHLSTSALPTSFGPLLRAAGCQNVCLPLQCLPAPLQVLRFAVDGERLSNVAISGLPSLRLIYAICTAILSTASFPSTPLWLFTHIRVRERTLAAAWSWPSIQGLARAYWSWRALDLSIAPWLSGATTSPSYQTRRLGREFAFTPGTRAAIKNRSTETKERPSAKEFVGFGITECRRGKGCEKTCGRSVSVQYTIGVWAKLAPSGHVLS